MLSAPPACLLLFPFFLGPTGLAPPPPASLLSLTPPLFPRRLCSWSGLRLLLARWHFVPGHARDARAREALPAELLSGFRVLAATGFSLPVLQFLARRQRGSLQRAFGGLGSLGGGSPPAPCPLGLSCAPTGRPAFPLTFFLRFLLLPVWCSVFDSLLAWTVFGSVVPYCLTPMARLYCVSRSAYFQGAPTVLFVRHRWSVTSRCHSRPLWTPLWGWSFRLLFNLAVRRYMAPSAVPHSLPLSGALTLPLLLFIPPPWPCLRSWMLLLLAPVAGLVGGYMRLLTISLTPALVAPCCLLFLQCFGTYELCVLAFRPFCRTALLLTSLCCCLPVMRAADMPLF